MLFVSSVHPSCMSKNSREVAILRTLTLGTFRLDDWNTSLRRSRVCHAETNDQAARAHGVTSTGQSAPTPAPRSPQLCGPKIRSTSFTRIMRRAKNFPTLFCGRR